jgi:methylated-DNA-[protein]-cysteine S-methyltransferase
MAQESGIYRNWFESPVGWISTGVTEAGVCELFFREGRDAQEDQHPLLVMLHDQLRAYFSGSLREFSLPLAPAGSPFQLKVWKELLNIGYGEVITYRDLGIRLGGPNYTRIAGQANGKNPVSLIIPCHRVIGMNGALTGYGGGLWRKKWLLEHEHRVAGGFRPVLF